MLDEWRSGNPSHDPVRVTHDLRDCSADGRTTPGTQGQVLRRHNRAILAATSAVFRSFFAKGRGRFACVYPRKDTAEVVEFSTSMVNGSTKKLDSAA
jgi:hypothetical protein